MKVFQYHPENSRAFTFMFPDFEKAARAARQICQGEFGMPPISTARAPICTLSLSQR
jgi:alkyldihydroxyacetonephosphate synthase